MQRQIETARHTMEETKERLVSLNEKAALAEALHRKQRMRQNC